MAEIILYGVIGETADGLDAKTVTAAVRGANGPLSVRINSPGGYVMEGLAIVEALRSYQGKVTIYIDGLAASMASVIAMVGDETIMAESALLMIHKPWDVAVGDAPELRRTAASLDKIEDQMIAIYAKRTGLAGDVLAQMLDAETWFDADEALAAGFVTSIAPALKIAASANLTPFAFRKTPDRLKETTMPQETDPNKLVAGERARITTIMALCEKHGLPGQFSRGLIDSSRTLDECRATILDELATRSDSLGIGHRHASGHVTLDDPDTYADAIKGALAAKISGKPAEGPAAQFRSMSIVNIARDYLDRHGVRNVTSMSDDRVIGSALSARGSATSSWGFDARAATITHGTSDFPDLLGGAAESYLIERYKRQESQLKRLARQSTRANFLMQYGVQTSGFGSLDKVNELGEFHNKTISTRKEGYKIDTYGNMFSVSRQMLINDTLGALADILSVMAGAAVELEATLIAALINGGNGYLMSDGQPWFSAAHGNVASAGAPPSIETLDDGRLVMRSQRDLDGVGLLDANPKFLLVPVQLQTAAETLVATTISPTKTEDVNPFQGKLEPIADPRLTNATAWYMFADPDYSPALEYSYLDGHETPFVDSQDGWRVDGTEYKVRHDFGAGVLDWRLAWKNPGA